ncbi:RHS repeat-associated core domain-containing protein [Cystobacter ferrugineus]|uniref:Type IV secretion protein Rhs n=1 Tax=Cystobacter ferrugineus TaxID=83449 RepID=A0A1L9BGQ5_9BACT|nr:RHS repeat-associated core domain-containing protein [Cystobacter ferrugineus]OJH41447.1 hypothetical protein BON30_11370 [Cystobacter ferrugineus]
MLAVKHLDPVLGVDIHFIITPPGAVVPIPHPHIGIVFDPFDYLPLIGATVKVNGLPRAQAGTGGRTLPPHFPIGGVFARPPGNENETFMGSSTVVVEDEPFTYMLLPVLSCQDIGMPSPPRKKGPGAKTLLLPLSIALSIPAGPPVFVGGPPTISLMGLGMRLAMGGLLKGLKKLRRVQQGSLRMRKLSDRIHRKAASVMDKLGLSQRARDRVHKALCTLTGHPVDVVTGRVVTEATDWELPGPIPLRFTRHYSSSLGWRDTAMGYGWCHSLDLAVWEEDGRVVYRAEDGRELEFDTTGFPRKRIPVGARLYSPVDRLTLRRVGELRWEVEAAEGLTHELRLVPGERQTGMCRVVRTYDRVGHSIAYEYDARGMLEWVVDSARRRLRFTHDARGRLVGTWLPHPSQPGLLPYNRYTYSDTGDLTEACDPMGYTTRYAYARHLLVREQDRTGLSFYFEYDGEDSKAWCVHTWGDGGIYDHRLRYDKQGRVTEVTNSLGHTTTYESDGRGVVVKEVDPLGSEWCYSFDEFLRLVSVVDPLGHENRHTYDGRGNLTETTSPDGARLRIEYNHQDNPTSATDACGGHWSWTYDTRGRLLTQLNPMGERSAYGWQDGLLVTLSSPDGTCTRFTHDAEGNMASIHWPDGSTTHYKHDRMGRLLEERDPRGAVRRLRHDLQGRVLEMNEDDGNCRRLTWDPEGNLLEGRDHHRHVRFSYWGFHKLASSEEHGTRSELHYDTECQLREVKNGRGESVRLNLDACGRVVEEHGFDGGIWHYRWDGSSRLLEAMRPSGKREWFEYDAAGRVSVIRFADGAQHCFKYRIDGALLEASNEFGVVRFERDGLGRLLREWQDKEWIESRYDKMGRRIQMESSLGMRESMVYDNAGSVASISIGPARRPRHIDFRRDAAGTEVERHLPGGAKVLTALDALGRPVSQRLMSPRGTLRDRSYTWQPGSFLESLSDMAHGQTRYHHDERGHLVAARYPDGTVEHRASDASGNLYRSPSRQDRKYGPGGVLLEAGGTHYSYDADGNLIEKNSATGAQWKYHYDGAGQLKEVRRPDGTCVSFSYDALGRRTVKRWADVEVQWIWDRDVLLHEQGKEGSLTTWFFEPDSHRPLAKTQGDECFALVGDPIGTPISLVDEAGQLAWKAVLDIYGKAHVEVARTTCPWRWPGQYEDAETGLYYNRFRYYDPESGRYISKDPLGLAGGLNPYAYTRTPLTLIDPLGLLEEFGIAPYASTLHKKDGFDAHELLQSAWLEHNHSGYKGRDKGMGRKNPAMALDPDFHSKVTAAQRAKGLHDADSLKKMSAMENILTNAEILEKEMIKDGMDPRKANKLARQLKVKATRFARLNGCTGRIP